MQDYKITPAETLQVAESSSSYSMKMIQSSRIGVTRKDFLEFVRQIRQSIQSLSAIIPASYSSLTKKKVFDQETSERIFEIAQIYAIGIDVFGDLDRFNDWLHSVSVPLGGVTPFSLLDTGFGFDLVKKEISRIDYGIFS